MPAPDPKFMPVSTSVHLNPEVLQNVHVNPVVNPVGVTAEAWTALHRAVTAQQQAINALQQTVTAQQQVVAAQQQAVAAQEAANSSLVTRVAELEKEMAADRLVVQGIDPSFAALKQELADLRAEYSSHCHSLPFSYESFTFLTATSDNNKPNFLIPYVWEGSNQNMTDFEREQDAEKVGAATSSPMQKPA